jgi:hypothetical protein
MTDVMLLINICRYMTKNELSMGHFNKIIQSSIRLHEFWLRQDALGGVERNVFEQGKKLINRIANTIGGQTGMKGVTSSLRTVY